MSATTSAFEDLLLDSPIIGAVKDEAGLEKVLASDCRIIFLLFGTVLNIQMLVEKAKQKNRMVFVHTDLIEGLSGKEIAIDYLLQNTDADGIISTRINQIKYAKSVGLFCIQRFFVIDSLSFENVKKQASYADAVDILPGTMPKIIDRLSKQLRKPIIASGLIQDKQDIMAALGAGAHGVSTTCSNLWKEL
ncbi:MAG: glycerol-3-phosphate responsive antiterminator [Lachnospiraceae bacterium]|nr:glycerol-3-phosphate responsive antiterminator [Lachnospiraceae bacterium]